METKVSRNAVPWAKSRILETADVLFYEDGIRAVGVDRLISESSVTKATFYKHYGSKDTLILAYVNNRHEAMKARVEAIIAESTGPEDALLGIIADLAGEIAAPGYRGCAFLNAAADFSDVTHPVRILVSEHRDWYTEVFHDLLVEIGHAHPGDGSDVVMLACDGARSGGYAGDPIAATGALHRVVARVIETAKGK